MSAPAQAPPLEYMNRTELLQILSGEQYGYQRIRASVPKERLIHLIVSREPARPEEIAQTSETRRKLQLWIDRNRTQIESQLPCQGPNRGKCTIYPCSEGKHLDCYLGAQKYML